MPEIIIPLCDPVHTGSWAFHIELRIGGLTNPLHTNMTIVMGTLTILLVGFGLTWVTKNRN